MKFFLFLMPLFLSFNGLSQTLEIENRHLNSFEGKEFKQKQVEWLKFLDEIKKYPDLCWDDKEEEFICAFTIPLNGTNTFEMVKEWVALTYKDYNSVLNYSNEKTGKIILKPVFKFTEGVFFKSFGTQKVMTDFVCSETIIISIKDTELSMLFKDLELGSYPLKQFFPLTAYNKSIEMLTYHNVANRIMSDIDDTYLSLKKHLE